MSRTVPRHEPDLAAIGYPAVREAFNEVLQAFVAKLTKADWEMAIELLGAEQHDELDDDALADEDGELPDELLDDDEDVEPTFDPFEDEEEALFADLLGQEETGQDLRPELLADTALFSRPGNAWSRAKRKRAVDRLARKMPFKRDPLKASIAERLPQAFFSLFESKGRQADGTVLVADLLDEERAVPVRDDGLARSGAKPGTLFAGRLVDLGPWHLGFGIFVPLRKSEAVALLLAVSHPGSLEEKRDALHEIVYLCHLHDEDMVMAALAPLIGLLSLAIDGEKSGPLEIVGPLRSALQEAFVP